MAASDNTPPPEYTRFVEVLAALDLPPGRVQVFEPAHPWFDATRPLLVLPESFAAARAVLAGRYPEGHSARAAIESHVRASTVEALPATAQAWCLDPLPAEEDARSLSGLRAVMERLYGPDGCPWDREQTHESLRKYLLEECYELVEAIDRRDAPALREELGDLLAHVFMHTSIAQEQGEFTVEDVTESAVRKMVRRHPHVFGDEAAGSNEELLARWDEIKAAERAVAGVEAAPGALDSIPLAAPALQRAQSLQQRAARAGALEPQAAPFDDLTRAVEALAATPSGTGVANVLWSAVRVARSLDVDAEEALREAASAFVDAFREIEAAARARSTDLTSLPEAARARAWLRATGRNGTPAL